MKYRFSENALKKKIQILTVGILICSFVIVLLLGTAIYKIREADKTSHDVMTDALMNEYKINMERQFNSDFESLQLLLNFINNSRYVDYKNFMYGLEENKQWSQFLRIGFYDKEGYASRVSYSNAVETEISYEELNEAIQAIIPEAMDGENVVSEVYMSEDFNKWVISYAIPILNKKEDEVIGALVATKDIEDFQEILKHATLSDETLDIDWINQNGDFLTWSDNSLIEEQMSNIFEGNYMDPSEKKVVADSMKKKKMIISQLEYNGQEYPIHLQPLNYNGWYLIYLDNGSNIVSPVFSVLNSVVSLFSLVCTICFAGIFYLFYLFKRANRSVIDVLFYDSLTQAWNIEKFKEELSLNIDGNKSLGIVSFNIRDFRFINEIIGRSKADRFLKEIIDTFGQVLPEKALYARKNADQFYLSFYETDEQTIKTYINTVIQKILESQSSKNINYQICFNTGIYIASHPKAEDIDLYIECSDFAKNQFMRNGENSLIFYDETMESKENLEKFIESHKLIALKNGEFKFFLQPKYNLEKNVIDGAEALVRWIGEDGKCIFPDQFIPLFEQNGFSIQLDLYMFEKACQKIRYWIDHGITPINISVNQSKLLFYRADYVETLKGLLDKYRIPQNLITLEILEGLASENIDELNKIFSELQKIGLMISLDDFGTGYSSLNVLSSFNIDEVKFDRQFLLEKSCDKKKKNLLCLESIIGYTKQLKIATVVEGVELEKDIEFLREVNCQQAQGYYFSKPICEEEFDRVFM